MHFVIVNDYRPTSLGEVITHLQKFLKLEIFEFQVRREHILEDLLQETRKISFHPLKRVKVRSYGVLCIIIYYLLYGKKIWHIGPKGCILKLIFCVFKIGGMGCT